MVVIETFYHLVEQNHIIISNIWRVLPMTFIIAGSIFGILYAFIVGRFKERFSKRCVLYAVFYVLPQFDRDIFHLLNLEGLVNQTQNGLINVAYQQKAHRSLNASELILLTAKDDYYENTTNLPILTVDLNDYEHGYLLINNTNNGTISKIRSLIQLPNIFDIKWSPEETCDFIQFTPLCCSLIGITVLSLFIMFGKGGNSAKNGLRSPWRIVLPSLILSTIFAILSIVTLRFINKGVYIFCKNFVQTYGWMSCNEVLNTVSRRLELDNAKRIIRNREFIRRHGLISYPNGTISLAATVNESAKKSTELPLFFSMHSRDHSRQNFPAHTATKINFLTTHELYYLSELFLGIAMSAWILCALFLVIRIVTTVDFQLISVKVSTVEVVKQTTYNLLNDASEALASTNGEDPEKLNLLYINENKKRKAFTRTSSDVETLADLTEVRSTTSHLSNFTVISDEENVGEVKQSKVDLGGVHASEPYLYLRTSYNYPYLDSKTDGKSVNINNKVLETIYDRPSPEQEEEEEVEMDLTTSPDPESIVTLASPEQFDDEDETEDSSFEMVDLQPKVSRSKKFYRYKF